MKAHGYILTRSSSSCVRQAKRRLGTPTHAREVEDDPGSYARSKLYAVRLCRLLVVLVPFLLSACSADQLSMVVELRTDFVAGTDFDSVETRIDGARPTTTDALLGQAFAEGRRVAAFDDVGVGTHMVAVTLFTGSVVVATRHVVVDFRDSSTVTILVTRDCVDIVCPGRGDAPNLTECHGGRCVEPECNPDTPDACGTAECMSDDDCPGGVACATPRCATGACLLAPDDSACAATERCDPVEGCVALPVDSGTDAGPADTGPDVGLSDTGPADTTAPPPPCGDVFGAVEDYMLCSEQPDACEFYVGADRSDCDSVCGAAGQSCVEAYDADTPGCERLG